MSEDFNFDFSGLDVGDDALDGVNFGSSLESVLGDIGDDEFQEPAPEPANDIFAAQLGALDFALDDDMVQSTITPELAPPETQPLEIRKSQALQELEDSQKRIKENYLDSIKPTTATPPAGQPSTSSLKAMLDGPSLFEPQKKKMGSSLQGKAALFGGTGPSLVPEKPMSAALKADQELFKARAAKAKAAQAVQAKTLAPRQDKARSSDVLKEGDAVDPGLGSDAANDGLEVEPEYAGGEEAGEEEGEEEGWAYYEWQEGDEEEEGVEYTYVEYDAEEEEGYEEEGVEGTAPDQTAAQPPPPSPSRAAPPPPAAALPPPPHQDDIPASLANVSRNAPPVGLAPAVPQDDIPASLTNVPRNAPPVGLPPAVPQDDIPASLANVPSNAPPVGLPPAVPTLVTPVVPALTIAPPSDLPPPNPLALPLDLPPPIAIAPFAVTPRKTSRQLDNLALNTKKQTVAAMEGMVRDLELQLSKLPPGSNASDGLKHKIAGLAGALAPLKREYEALRAASVPTNVPPPPPPPVAAPSSVDATPAVIPSDMPPPPALYLDPTALLPPSNLPPPSNLSDEEKLNVSTQEAAELFGEDFFDMIEEVAELPRLVITPLNSQHAPAPPLEKCTLCETQLDDEAHSLRLCTECNKGTCRSCTKMMILKSFGESEQRAICSVCIRLITVRVQSMSPRVHRTSIDAADSPFALPPPEPVVEKKPVKQLTALEKVALADRNAKWAGDQPVGLKVDKVKKKEKRGSFRKKVKEPKNSSPTMTKMKKEKAGGLRVSRKDKKKGDSLKEKKNKKKESKGLYSSNNDIPQLKSKPPGGGIYSSHGSLPLVSGKKKTIYSSHDELKLDATRELKLGASRNRSSSVSVSKTSSTTPSALVAAPVRADLPPVQPRPTEAPGDLPPPPPVVPLQVPEPAPLSSVKKTPRTRVSGAPKPKPKPEVAKVKLKKAEPVAAAPLKTVVKAEKQVWDYGTQARALCSYKAEDDSQLSFDAGTLLIVTKVDSISDGVFLHGYVEGTIRIKKFPANVVERVVIK